MAEIDVVQQPGQDQNFLGYSRGPIPDTAIGGFLSDAATMLQTGVQAAHGIIRQGIREDLTANVDRIREDTGREYMDQAGNQQVDNFRNRIQMLGEARNQGRVNESYYWALLDMESRRVRQRWPGMREHIDNIMQDLVGANPANRLVAELAREAQARGASRADESQHWIRAAVTLGLLDEQTVARLAASPQGMLELRTMVNNANRSRLEIENENNRLNLEHNRRRDVTEGTERMAYQEITTRLADRSNAVVLGITNAQTDIQALIAQQTTSGRQMSATELNGLAERFQTQIVNPQNELIRQILYGQRTDQDGNVYTLASRMGEAATQRVLESQRRMLNLMGSSIREGNWHAYSLIHDQLQAVQRGETLSLLTTEPFMRRLQALSTILGPNFVSTELFKDFATQDTRIRRLLSASLLEQATDGTSLSTIIQDLRRTNPGIVTGSNVHNLVGAGVNAIINPNTPDQVRTALARSLFGPENANFLNGVGNRAQVYHQMVGDPRLHEIMQRFRTGSTEQREAYNNFRRWATEGFQNAFRQVATDANEAIGSGQFSMVYNAETHQFSITGGSQAQRSSVEALNRTITGLTNMLTAEGNMTAEQRNQTIGTLVGNLGINPNQAQRGSVMQRFWDTFRGMTRSSTDTDVQTRHVSPLLDLIGEGEANRFGYTTVFGRNREEMQYTGLTNMTITEVRDYMRDIIRRQAAGGVAEGARSSAIGRYQFTQATFDRMVQRLGLTPDTRFTPEVQDRMALALITDNPAFRTFMQDPSPQNRARVVDYIASQWAGLQDSRGVGRYDNDSAGNRARIPTSRINDILDQVRRSFHGG